MNEEGTDPELDELLAKAYSSEGVEQIAHLEEAARLADQRRNLEAGLEVRNMLVDAATWAGFYEKSLIAFNWMLAQCDRHPEQWDEYQHRLLWLYKWILEHLHQFPQITPRQIEATFADMEARYTKAGEGLKAVYQLRCLTAIETGHAAKAATYYQQWHEAEEDTMGDCKACVRNAEVVYHLLSGDAKAAIKHAAPLLKGKMFCSEVPGITQARLLVPLLQNGKSAQAVASQKASYRQMRESRKFLAYLAQHLLYHALVGEHTKAVKLLEARLGWAIEARNQHDRFTFLQACRVLLARLAAGGKASIKLALPQNFPSRNDESRYDTAALAAQFLDLSKEIAAAFDRRNGNDLYARLIAANEALIILPTFERPEPESKAS